MGREKKSILIVLSVIILLSAVLRFWQLGSNPPGLTWDEAALGYNAYSILKTGKDEYGTFLPLNFKSFGDFKPGFYVYLTIPFIATLGLNEWAIRLPSAFFGVGLVVLIFFLIYELFENYRLAIFGAFFNAVSPLTLQFSRAAFETNVALFLNTLGIFLFLKGLKNKRLLIWSALPFGLSLFAYQASRVFVPLIVAVLVILFLKKIKKEKRVIYPALILAAFFLIFLMTTFLGGQTARLSTLNFFAYQRSADEINLISKEDNLAVNSWQFQIFHGEWWSYTKGLAERYFIYFSPKMLAIDGDYDPRQKVPDLGVLYYFSIVLLPLGIIYFLKKRSPSSTILFIWLLLAPIPAVLSRDLINMIRALNLAVPFMILEAGGLLSVTFWLKRFNKKIFLSGLLLVAIVFIFNFVIYLDRYFIHAPKEYSKYWLYGYKQVFEQTGKLNLQNFNRVVVTDTYGQPYIYYLFYTQYPPAKFQQQAALEQKTVDVGTVRKIDNIEFRKIYWPADRGSKNSLFLGNDDDLPEKDIVPFKEYKILDRIKFLDGQTAFKIVQTE